MQLSLFAKIASRLSLLAALVVTAVAAQTGPKGDIAPDAEYKSYLAHIAAASAALRLNNTAEAKNWLANAPKKFRGWEWAYLNGESEKSIGQVGNHKASVVALAVSPDGESLASASSDRTVRIVKLSDGSVVHAFSDEKLVPQAVAFSPDGRRLAAAHSGHVIRVWSLSDGAEVLKIQGQGKGITSVAFSPSGRTIASCSWNRNDERGVWGIVELHNADTGELTKQLEYGTKPLVAIAYSPNGKYLAVGSWEVDQNVAVWRTDLWGKASVMEWDDNGAYKAIQTVAFSPDSTKLAAGGKDSLARIWDVESKKTLHRLGGRGWGHGAWVNAVAFAHDGKLIATASNDQNIRLWNVETGAELAILRGHTKPIHAIAFGKDGKRLYSGSADTTIRTWISTVGGGEVLRPGVATYGVAFSPDGRRLVSAGWKGKLQLWDSLTGELANSWDAHDTSANAVAFSSDGKYLASVGNDAKIMISDAHGGRILRTLETVKGHQLIRVAFAGDGGTVVSASSAGAAKSWDAETGRELRTFKHENGVTCVGASPNGKLIATGGTDGSVYIWDESTGRKITEIWAGRSRIVALNFSPDNGKLGVSAGRDIKLFDVRSAKEIAFLTGHDAGVSGFGFSPDGKRLVSGSSDQTVKVWDTRTGLALLTIHYENQVYGAIFSPDGKAVLTLPLDGTIRILASKME